MQADSRQARDARLGQIPEGSGRRLERLALVQHIDLVFDPKGGLMDLQFDQVFQVCEGVRMDCFEHSIAIERAVQTM